MKFPAFFENVKKEYSNIILIANSIGAYFVMNCIENIPILTRHAKVDIS